MRDCSNYWERYYENLSVDSAEVEKWQPCGALPKFVKTYLNPSDLILDIGCGSGRNACFLAENNLTVSGLDLSSRAVDFCQKRFSRQKLFGEFRQGSLQHIPFESSYFDAIICVGTIDHVTLGDARRGLLEMRRVLRDSGVILLTFDPYDTDQEIIDDAEVLNDGTFRYIRGSQKGMLFRRYRDDEIMDLIGSNNIVAYYSRRVIICR